MLDFCHLRDILTDFILLKAGHSLGSFVFIIKSQKKSNETHLLLKSVSHFTPPPRPPLSLPPLLFCFTCSPSSLFSRFFPSPTFSLFSHWNFPAFGRHSPAVWPWWEAADRTRRSQTLSAAVAAGRAASGFSTPEERKWQGGEKSCQKRF